MNSNRILLIVFIGLMLVAGTFYFYKGNPKDSGFDLSDRQFAEEDITKIGLISIERKDYPKIIFTKNGNNWTLNNGRDARNESVNYITSVIHKLKIKYIPNQAGSQKIIEIIKQSGIKVILFDNNKKHIKTFYVGPDLGDGTGTGFLMEGAKQPYVMFVPGFQGSIRTRFLFQINEYESKAIFNEVVENIKSVEVNYPYDRPSSYYIERKAEGYEFYNPYDKLKLPKLNEKLIEAYLENFSDVVAESNDANNKNKEEILKSKTYCEITLKRKNGTERKLTLYSLPNIEWDENKYSPKEVSEDTRFIAYSSEKQFLLVQQRVMKKILLAFDSFAIRN